MNLTVEWTADFSGLLGNYKLFYLPLSPEEVEKIVYLLTALVLLNKLLTEQGLTPAILDEPYVSSWSPLADWKTYLEEGMAKWQEARINAVK